MGFMQLWAGNRRGGPEGGIVDHSSARQRHYDDSEGFDLPPGFVPVRNPEVARLWLL